MMKEQIRKEHIYGIDILRFCSALLVCILHFRGNGAENPFVVFLCKNFSDVSIKEYSRSIFDYLGFIGVEVFFTISGFVIAYSLNKSPTILDFFKGRIVRIYPSLILLTFICAILTTLSGYYQFPSVTILAIRDLTLFPVGFHLNGVVWTLTIEVIFYVISAAVYLKGGRSLKAFIWFYSIASALYCVTDIYLNNTHTLEKGYLDLFEKIARLTLLEHGMYFSLGIVMYEVFVGGKRIALYAVPLILIPIAILFSISGVTEFYLRTEIHAGAPTSPIFAIAVYFVCATAMGLSIYYSKPLAKFGNGFIFNLGRLTYPLYLSHIYVGGAFCYLAVYFGYGQFGAPIAIIGSIVVSYFIALHIEPVVSSFVKRLLDHINPHFPDGHRLP